MRGEIVALDLETTGLDPELDAIIEIGAVRFRDREILETFNTFIDPGISIPANTTALTGIADADVTGAPQLEQIAGKLRDFIGDTPILGHNISFDMGFLHPYKIGLDNQLIDTYELAAFLIPTAPRYSLVSLIEMLGLEIEQAHRGLDDAMATVHLYWVLWDKIVALPFNTLKEIVTASEYLEWDAKLPLIEALRLRSHTDATAGRQQLPFKSSARTEWEILRANQDVKPISVDTLAGLIEPGGRLAQHIPSYESRASQIDMLKTVATAFNNSHHTMIEAPTGTGKSIAYLIPAIYWSLTNNTRVVVSTATIALQDQLMSKDIPLLQEVLGAKFKAAVMKGRGNYLCPRRLEAMRRRHPTSVDELRVLAKILVWLLETDSGDRGEISLRGFGEDVAWLRLSAQDEGCKLTRCETQMKGACPFFKSRRRAEGAHIVVANHSLLLSDVQLDSRVMPDYQYLVIDEAHHLEDATTRGLMAKLDRATIRRRFSDLGDTKQGLFGEMLESWKGNISDKHYERIEAYVETLTQAIKDMGDHVDAYFISLIEFLDESGEVQRGEYASQVRITPTMREHVLWQVFCQRWTNLSEFLGVISNSIGKIFDALEKLHEKNPELPNYEDHMNSLQTATRYLEDVKHQLRTFTLEPEQNMIYWCELKAGSNQPSINAAPLHVGPLVEAFLWKAKEAIVLTSATLTTGNSFSFVRERLGATENYVDELTVPTPFDYENSTLIYIPTDLPEPTDRVKYQSMLERGMIELATATHGRMLGLFTSYSQLRETAQKITPRLALGGISVLDQASGSSRQLLIESFKSLDKAVLLGTRSFWEGVDLPGDDLQALVIARLPFSVPSDPIFAARSETFEDSFMDYSVPDAILRFRQGFGRLIRRRTDRGVVAIFDRRVISKKYGRIFLDSLPKCTVQYGALANLPRVAQHWITR